MLIALLLIAQLVFFIILVKNGSKNFVWLEYVFSLVSIAVVLHVVGSNMKCSYKLIWTLLILSFPVFGGLFYLLFKYQSSTKRLRGDLSKAESDSKSLFILPGNYLEDACRKAPDYMPQIRYLHEFAGFPIYGGTQTKYLTPGEEIFKELVDALKDAKRYIFLEYFIISEGVMWNTILDILKEKAASGVEVRVMYDDVGCFFVLPEDYPAKLESMGIRCAAFNPFRPLLTTKQNNRDHRKLAIIDGEAAFTGGNNLADEYINAVNRFGHWKDAAVRVTGKAAWSFTLMFLQMWSMCKNDDINYEDYYPWKNGECGVEDDGLVQPYADSPMDNENIGEQVYLQIIGNAKKYVYINTPYLIVDDGMVSALNAAAKSGIDVRIVTPSIGDKWYAHMTTRSYYRDFIRAGVKIYEYLDGFIHSKTFVADDKVATVGTINLDFRSLYLHFECGVWMYGGKAVAEVRDDFINTLDKCKLITEDDCKGNRLVRFAQDILRLSAPLM